MSWRSLPNIITGLRLLLAVPLVITLLLRDYSSALVILVVAGLSDVIDGNLARHFKWQSKLGAVLDPASDKVLLASSYIALWAIDLLPLWLVTLVFVRDLVIVLGAGGYYLLFGKVDMQPSLLSKFNTLFQILLLLAVVVASGPYSAVAPLIEPLIVVVVVTTLGSGLHYVWTWGWRAWCNEQGGDDDCI